MRLNGGVPATIGVLNGIARVGLGPEELIELLASAGKTETRKLSRRDLGFICGLVRLRFLTICAFICEVFADKSASIIYAIIGSAK